MWIDWYRKYQPAEPEYEVWWWVSEVNESQTSYSVEQADIFQYQSYSHSDDMFIILKSNINMDTSIFVFSLEKSHDSKYSKDASTKTYFISSLQIYHSFLQIYINVRLLNFSFNGDIHWFFLLQTSKSAIGFTGFVYQCRSVLENTKVTTSLMT